MRACINTSDMSYTNIINGMAEMLDRYNWDLFATLTTAYSMKLPVARKKAIKLYENLRKQCPGTQMFYAAEHNDSLFGYHLHSLINLNQNNLTASQKKTIVKTMWQRVSRGGPNNLFNWTDIRIYDKRAGAHFYLAKYTMRDDTEWELFI
jgi:hypothetical protein